MRVFLDFEASSLGRHGFPVEVAWVFEDGKSESFLIRPAADWTEWDPAAEGLHGISRARLDREGEPVELVAGRLVDALAGHEVFASAPSWDGKWLSRLLRVAGFPRHAIRLTDIDDGLSEVTRALLSPVLQSSEIHRAARRILAAVEARFESRKREHRALPDARFERARWLAVVEQARAYGSDPPAASAMDKEASSL